jgi:uncharacterized protein (DUF433 family)
MDRIELNPRVCNGKPVIKGTRIPVSVILEQVAQGESWDTLIESYPEPDSVFIITAYELAGNPLKAYRRRRRRRKT